MEELGTKTGLRIMEVLLESPLQEFKEIELIKKAKTGKGSASNLINNLVKENILLEKRIGKTKLISLNLHNNSVFLIKNLFDQEKIFKLENHRLAAIALFTQRISKISRLSIVFGSSIAGTYKEESDIDILIASNYKKEIQENRKIVEELFNIRFNLHFYKEDEVKEKIKDDMLIQNAILKGVITHGYDFGRELFSAIKPKDNLERLFFFNERIKSALRNYNNKDYRAAEEILDRTVEQITLYILSDKGIGYTSKEDAKKSIKKIPEVKIIWMIDKFPLKKKIEMIEELILTILTNKILKNEGYA